MTDSGTKCAWLIHESKAVQIHVNNNRRCLYVPRMPGSGKNPHNNNPEYQSLWFTMEYPCSICSLNRYKKYLLLSFYKWVNTRVSQ